MSKSSARVLKGKGFWLALLAGVALLVLMGWMAARPAQADPNHVFIDPATDTVALAGTVTVDVNAQGSAAGLGAWDISVMYDSTLLTATGCTTSAPGATVEVCNPDSGGTGDTVRFIGASTAGVTGADAAAVTLGTITFDAGTTEDTATLTVTVADFRDPANVDISTGLTASDGTITIGGTPPPPDTPVPPTATPPPPFPFGDVDCSGTVDAVDALKIQRWIAGLSVDQEPGCPAIGP